MMYAIVIAVALVIGSAIILWQWYTGQLTDPNRPLSDEWPPR